jgi:hypothetical protein
MASQVNPLSAGMVTDDPRFNARYLDASNFGGQNSLLSGIGVPSNTVGQNGDFCLRFDGTEAGHTVLYHKESGAWVATAA